MKKIVTIRDRGQMTLPSKFRDQFKWLEAGNAVEVEVVEDGKELIVRPVGGADERPVNDQEDERPTKDQENEKAQPDNKKDWSKFQKGIEKLRKTGEDMGDIKDYLIQERKV